MNILDRIKAIAKPGEDLTSIEKAIKDIEDLNPINSVKTTDEALAFISRNSTFQKALDFETTRRLTTHDDKFKTEKLPDLLKAEREKVMKELNPEETPKDKEIRELKEWKNEQEKKEGNNVLKARLRDKAKELEYDPIRAERFYIYGEKAEEMLADEVEFHKGSITKAVEGKIKDKYKNDSPNKSNTDPAKIMTRADHDKLRTSDPEGAAAFFRNGGSLED